MQHPHILKITSDQHSPFVSGFAGDPWVRTPNLDRLAESGVVFENHYCANPVCLPGRNSMITGRLPRKLGTPYFWDVLPSDVPTYMSHFSCYGYQTTCVGKMHFHGQDQMHGWLFRPYGDMETLIRENLPDYERELDLYAGAQVNVKISDYGGYNPYMLKTARPGTDKFMLFDESVTRESCLHLRDYFSTLISEYYQGERPLLFEVSFKTPHAPFICPPDLFNYYYDVVEPPRKPRDPHAPPQIKQRQKSDQPEDITEEMVRRSRAGYWGLVQWMDEQIGLVLNALEQTGMRDRFFVMYTSDHGELAGERGLWQKSCFYEESARVPMIIAGWDLPHGRRIQSNTSHLDIFPTLCDIAGLPVPEDISSQSMLPLIASDANDEQIVISEYYLEGGGLPENGGQRNGMMAKKGSFKYIDYCDGSAELFDLAQDPDEQRNLSGVAEYSDVEAVLLGAMSSLSEPWRVHRPEWRMQARPRGRG